MRRRNRGRYRGDKEKGGPAILTIRSMTTESLHPITDRRRRFLVCRSNENYFPATEYASFDAFLNAHGSPVKSEPRTRIVRLRRQVNGPREKAIRSFVLKTYHYPLLVFTYFATESIKNRTHEFRRRFNGKRSKWTLDSREVKELSRSAGFEVVQSIWMSRFFSGHRYVLLRRTDSTLVTPCESS